MQNWPKIQTVRKSAIIRTVFLRIYGILFYIRTFWCQNTNYMSNKKCVALTKEHLEEIITTMRSGGTGFRKWADSKNFRLIESHKNGGRFIGHHKKSKNLHTLLNIIAHMRYLLAIKMFLITKAAFATSLSFNSESGRTFRIICQAFITK